jgi:hypothetical protein
MYVREKPKGQSKMDNPETWAMLGAQDTVEIQTKQKSQNTKLKGCTTRTPLKTKSRGMNQAVSASYKDTKICYDLLIYAF